MNLVFVGQLWMQRSWPCLTNQAALQRSWPRGCLPSTRGGELSPANGHHWERDTDEALYLSGHVPRVCRPNLQKKELKQSWNMDLKETRNYICRYSSFSLSSSHSVKKLFPYLILSNSHMVPAQCQYYLVDREILLTGLNTVRLIYDLFVLLLLFEFIVICKMNCLRQPILMPGGSVIPNWSQV